MVWIADFGLAKADDEGLTLSGDVLGTIRYMAPERFRGEGDARADVYALGLTLYELLTLHPGFESSDRLSLMERIKTEEPPRPRSVDGRIPRDLETIVLKAIEKDPKARYQTAQAMGDDLGRFLADEPIKARQVSAAERYWRWARRNPVIAVLGGVLTAVLVLVTIGSLLAAGRFKRLAEREGQSAIAERSARQETDLALKTAETARNAAQAETYLALLSEVKALRFGHRLGWREEALANLARLTVMPTPRRDLVELRTRGCGLHRRVRSQGGGSDRGGRPAQSCRPISVRTPGPGHGHRQAATSISGTSRAGNTRRDRPVSYHSSINESVRTRDASGSYPTEPDRILPEGPRRRLPRCLGAAVLPAPDRERDGTCLEAGDRSPGTSARGGMERQKNRHS